MADITILTAGQPGGLVTPPATMPPGTILGNNGSGFAAPVPLTVPTLTAMLQPLGNFGVDTAVPGDAQDAGLIASNVVTPVGCTQGWNWYRRPTGQAFLNPGAAGQWCFDTVGNLTFGIAGQGGGTVAGQPISGFIGQLILTATGAMTLERDTLSVARDPVFPLEVATRQWVIATIAAGAGAVVSVFGRTGAVAAQAGDYAFPQISGTLMPAQLPVFTSAAIGAVPASGGGTSAFLRADGTWNPVSFAQVTGSLSPAQMTLFTSGAAGAVPASGGGTLNFLRAAGTWQPLPVTSVFGRTGAITAQTNDYSFSQISGTVGATQLPLFTATANGAVAASGAGASLTVGTTPIGGGATGQVLYDNAGILGVYTQASLTAYINAFTPTTAGTVPASGGGTTTFLRADGTWVVPPGGGGAAGSITVGATTVVGGTTGRVLYNSAGLVGEYTQAQLTGQILAFTPTTAGVVSASGGGTVNFLRADGSWSPLPSAPVASVFGRTGAVVAATNDYSFSQISGIIGPAQLPLFTASANGAVVASGGGTTNFLRADGTWAAPATAAAPVTSVFGRTGAIVATSGDYSFSQITGTAAPAQLPMFSSVANGIVAASGGGTTNFLRADGTWAQPAATAFTRINIQKFTASGSYTPTAGTKYAIVECVGGGGGGGAASTGTASVWGAGGGGGSGGYSRSLLNAATIGASQSVTIGNGGASTANGAATSFGTLCVANGGLAGGSFDGSTVFGVAGLGAVAGTGDVTLHGNAGFNGTVTAISASVSIGYGGAGGAIWGGVTNSPTVGSGNGSVGNAANANSGAGGNGAVVNGVATFFAGGAGGSGYCAITEFI